MFASDYLKIRALCAGWLLNLESLARGFQFLAFLLAQICLILMGHFFWSTYLMEQGVHCD